MTTIPRFLVNLPHQQRALRARSVAFGAFRAGGFSSFILSSSSRCPTGATLRCFFSTRSAAQAHARRTARRGGWPVTVGHSPHGWQSAAPVSNRHTRLPGGAGWVHSVKGGLRQMIQVIDGAGIGNMD